MKNLSFLILGLAVIIGSIFLFFQKPMAGENKIKIIKINDTGIEVEVVDTPERRKQGLSGRESLEDGIGMFFIFDNPAQYGFWMKDMRFAIDIVWIDENYQIVGVEKSVTPDTFPKTFYPVSPIKYVLEIPAGFTNQHHIDIGAMVQF